MIVATLVSLIGVAWACPVCGAPGANNEHAYVAMTGVLSLLPLAFMGGVGYWIYRAASAPASDATSSDASQ